MRRTDRLFEIVQIFRDGRLHKAADIADRLEVSLRTVYRDIDTLVASGEPITGERGLGIVMTGQVFLPPLNVTPAELEALELGIALVRAGIGPDLAGPAQALGDKVRAVLPRPEMLSPDRGAVGVHAPLVPDALRPALSVIRRAILDRAVLGFGYEDAQGRRGARTVRPLEIEIWQGAFTLTAWCETRGDFRVFRIDRMTAPAPTGARFRPERGRRMADYLARQRGA